MIESRREKGLYWDKAWKLVEGCTKVSPGCDNCWSEQETAMRAGHPNRKIRERAQSVVHLSQIPGDITMFDGRILCREDNLDLPLRTKKPTVWAIWNDLYHEDVFNEFRDRAYAVMALCPQHTFLVLTKRAERMARFFAPIGGTTRLNWVASAVCKIKDSTRIPKIDWPLPNVWHGVTAENQEQADARIPHLLNVPGKRFLSVEPMLSAIDLSAYFGGPYYSINSDAGEPNYNFGIDAVLLGGESGKHARPMHPDWVRSVRDQCAAAGVPFTFKQWGEWAPDCLCPTKKAHKTTPRPEPGKRGCMFRCGKKNAGRRLDGRTHDALPWDADGAAQ